MLTWYSTMIHKCASFYRWNSRNICLSTLSLSLSLCVTLAWHPIYYESLHSMGRNYSKRPSFPAVELGSFCSSAHFRLRKLFFLAQGMVTLFYWLSSEQPGQPFHTLQTQTAGIAPFSPSNGQRFSIGSYQGNPAPSFRPASEVWGFHGNVAKNENISTLRWF